MVAALLTGCSSGESDGEQSPQGADGAKSAPGKDGKSGAGVESFDAGAALATQTVTLPKNPEDRITLAVLSLTVQGKMMVLRLALTPDLASRSDSDSVNLFTSTGQTNFRPTLVDVENLKEYQVVLATGGGKWSSDDLGTEAQNGTPLFAYAYFAAPEDDIDDIDVHVTDFWPAFTDVPITR